MKLTGQKNVCPTCKQYFRSNAAFDKHRIGAFHVRPVERRCMTVPEMESAGMAKNAAGFWVTARNPFSFKDAA